MDNNCQLTARLLETYKDLSSDKAIMPSVSDARFLRPYKNKII